MELRIREFVGGKEAEEIARLLAEEAQRTGVTVAALCGNTWLVANPGVSAEAVLRRYEEDLAAKSEWFRSPDGVAFVEARRKA